MTVLERAYMGLEEAGESIKVKENNDAGLVALRRSLDHLASAFSIVVGAKCRVCIVETFIDSSADGTVATPGSQTTTDENGLYARVVMRSDAKLPDPPEEPHLVWHNTDFKHVYQEHEPFFCNDLISAWFSREYENSKWDTEAVNRGNIAYISTMVFPVESQITSQENTNLLLGSTRPRNETTKLIAFLCVDSRKRGAFDRSVDLAMGECYVHSLHPILRYFTAPADLKAS